MRLGRSSPVIIASDPSHLTTVAINLASRPTPLLLPRRLTGQPELAQQIGISSGLNAGTCLWAQVIAVYAALITFSFELGITAFFRKRWGLHNQDTGPVPSQVPWLPDVLCLRLRPTSCCN